MLILWFTSAKVGIIIESTKLFQRKLATLQKSQSSGNLHTKTVAMLRQQPNEFTSTAMAKTCSISKDYARVLIQRWLKDELIIQKDNKKPRKYQKTKKGEIV